MFSTPVKANGLTAPNISFSPGTIDVGQSLTLYTNANPSGGSHPYTCQWLQKAPGTSSYIALGSSFDCTTSVPPTTVSPTAPGVWLYKLNVTDSLGSSLVSNSVNPMVNVALAVPTLRPTVTIGTGQPTTASAIDYGQSVNVTVSWSGGTSTYSPELFSSNTNSCNWSNQIGSKSVSTTSSSYTFKQLLALSTNTWFCASVEDSSGSPVTLYSSAAEVAVNLQLVAPTISGGAHAIDFGQSLTLSTTSSFSGGTPTFSCQWLKETPGATKYVALGTKTACNSVSLPTASSGVLSKVGVWSFELQVTDSSSRPETALSNAFTVTVNARLVAPGISLSPRFISGGQSSTIQTITDASGGTPAYTCQWLQKAPGTSSYIALGSSFDCTDPVTYTGTAGPLSTPGVWHFRLTMNDSATVHQTILSNILTAIVSPPLSAVTVASVHGAIDVGESPTVKVTWSGGVATFTVALYSSNTSSCTTGSTLRGAVVGLVASSHTFGGLPVVGGPIWYCASVTDSSASPVAVMSISTALTVNPYPTPPVIGVSYGKLDKGQSQTVYTVTSFTGGTPSYTCQWLKRMPGGASFISFGGSFSCTQISQPLLKKPLSTVGTWFFELQVKDKTGAKVVSSPANVTVSSALIQPTIVFGSISLGKVTLSVTTPFSGGTAGYTCQVLGASQHPSGFIAESSSVSCGSSLSTITTFALAPGTWYLELQVIDSSGAPATVMSNPIYVIVPT